METLCQVCFEPKQLVHCKLCKVSAHRSCYPFKDSTCHPCLHNHSRHLLCAWCESRGLLLLNEDNEWGHVLCSLMSMDLIQSDLQKLKFRNIRPLQPNKSKLKCHLCSKKVNTSPLKFAYLQAQLIVHYECFIKSMHKFKFTINFIQKPQCQTHVLAINQVCSDKKLLKIRRHMAQAFDFRYLSIRFLDQEEIVNPCFCGIKAEGEIVECDRCRAWFHFKCVGFSQENIQNEFLCVRCTLRNQRQLQQISIKDLPLLLTLRQFLYSIRQPSKLTAEQKAFLPLLRPMQSTLNFNFQSIQLIEIFKSLMTKFNKRLQQAQQKLTEQSQQHETGNLNKLRTKGSKQLTDCQSEEVIDFYCMKIIKRKKQKNSPEQHHSNLKRIVSLIQKVIRQKELHLQNNGKLFKLLVNGDKIDSLLQQLSKGDFQYQRKIIQQAKTLYQNMQNSLAQLRGQSNERQSNVVQLMQQRIFTSQRIHQFQALIQSEKSDLRNFMGCIENAQTLQETFCILTKYRHISKLTEFRQVLRLYQLLSGILKNLPQSIQFLNSEEDCKRILLAIQEKQLEKLQEPYEFKIKTVQNIMTMAQWCDIAIRAHQLLAKEKIQINSLGILKSRMLQKNFASGQLRSRVMEMYEQGLSLKSSVDRMMSKQKNQEEICQILEQLKGARVTDSQSMSFLDNLLNNILYKKGQVDSYFELLLLYGPQLDNFQLYKKLSLSLKQIRDYFENQKIVLNEDHKLYQCLQLYQFFQFVHSDDKRFETVLKLNATKSQLATKHAFLLGPIFQKTEQVNDFIRLSNRLQKAAFKLNQTQNDCLWLQEKAELQINKCLEIKQNAQGLILFQDLVLQILSLNLNLTNNYYAFKLKNMYSTLLNQLTHNQVSKSQFLHKFRLLTSLPIKNTLEQSRLLACYETFLQAEAKLQQFYDRICLGERLSRQDLDKFCKTAQQIQLINIYTDKTRKIVHTAKTLTELLDIVDSQDKKEDSARLSDLIKGICKAPLFTFLISVPELPKLLQGEVDLDDLSELCMTVWPHLLRKQNKQFK